MRHAYQKCLLSFQFSYYLSDLTEKRWDAKHAVDWNAKVWVCLNLMQFTP